jgi:hypothetical protein
MDNREIQAEVEAILKSADKDIDDNINGIMWLLGFNLFVLSAIVLFMYNVGVAPKLTVLILFIAVFGQAIASIKWFGGELLKPLVIVGFTLGEFLLISCFSISDLNKTGKGRSISSKYNGACIATNLVKTSKNENGGEVIFFYFNSDQIDKAIEKVLVKEKCEHL